MLKQNYIKTSPEFCVFTIFIFSKMHTYHFNKSAFLHFSKKKHQGDVELSLTHKAAYEPLSSIVLVGLLTRAPKYSKKISVSAKNTT